MAQRHQRGWLKKEERAQGETWVLFFRTTRKIGWQTGGKQNHHRLGPTPSGGKQVHGPRSNDSMFQSTG